MKSFAIGVMITLLALLIIININLQNQIDELTERVAGLENATTSRRVAVKVIYPLSVIPADSTN